MSIPDLQSKFGRGEAVTFDAGVSGLPRVTIRLRSGARASLYLHGAHLTSYINEQGRELIFMSSKASITATSNIRGGIPVVFPQFGPTPLPGLKALPQHGFARNSNDWTVLDSQGSADEAAVTLELKDNEKTRQLWPHSFSVRLRTSLSSTADRRIGSALTQRLEVINKNESAPFDFTVLLHTYFAIPDVKIATISPLDGLTLLDKVGGGERSESSRAVSITGETDRVYFGAPNTIHISDGSASTIVLRKEGFKDLVMWNIWSDKAKGMADLGEGEWQKYVCVEVGSVKDPVHLDSGKTWTASQTICAVADLSKL